MRSRVVKFSIANSQEANISFTQTQCDAGSAEKSGITGKQLDCAAVDRVASRLERLTSPTDTMRSLRQGFFLTSCPEKGLDPDARIDFLCRSNGHRLKQQNARSGYVSDKALSSWGTYQACPDRAFRSVVPAGCFTIETAGVIS